MVVIANVDATFAQHLQIDDPPALCLRLPGIHRRIETVARAQERFSMPKGQEKPKTVNKPKLSIKEKKQKKKDKAATKGS